MNTKRDSESIEEIARKIDENVIERIISSNVHKISPAYFLDKSGMDTAIEMSKFNSIFCGQRPLYVARKVLCGNSYPNKKSIFDVDDDYFSFDGHGNLQSIPAAKLAKWFTECMDMIKYVEFVKRNGGITKLCRIINEKPACKKA